MTPPTVSVCIPAYRRPSELREGLASVLAQSFTDFEVVVGDDSGDLESVVAEFTDPRVRYVRNPRRLGMVENWTQLLNRARGRYRSLLMDDDLLLPGFLDATVPVLEADASIGVAYTNNYYVCAPETVERRCDLVGGRYQPFVEPLLRHAPAVPISAAIMRQEVWHQVKPLPDLLSADLVMYLRAAIAGWAFYYIDEPLMSYRVHAGQQTGQPGRFRSDLVDAWSLFEFPDDRVCEDLRRRYLAQSLTGRAAEHLKAGRTQEAASDLRAARALGVSGGARQSLLAALARQKELVAPALWLWRAVRRAKPAGDEFYSCVCRRGRPVTTTTAMTSR
jgi:glycosyltransferase involved in cell wall biosynthesis